MENDTRGDVNRNGLVRHGSCLVPNVLSRPVISDARMKVNHLHCLEVCVLCDEEVSEALMTGRFKLLKGCFPSHLLDVILEAG